MSRTERIVGQPPQRVGTKKKEFFELLRNDLPVTDYELMRVMNDFRINPMNTQLVHEVTGWNPTDIRNRVQSLLKWYNEGFNAEMRVQIRSMLGITITPHTIDVAPPTEASLAVAKRRREAQDARERREEEALARRLAEQLERERIARERREALERERLNRVEEIEKARREKQALRERERELRQRQILYRRFSKDLTKLIANRDKEEKSPKTTREIDSIPIKNRKNIKPKDKLPKIDTVRPKTKRNTERNSDVGAYTDDSFQLYMKEVRRYKLMTRQDEVVKFTERDRYRAAVESGEMGNDAHLLHKIEEEILHRNLRLVVHFAKRFQGQGVELLDLIQQGTMAMKRAIEKFEIEKGFKLSTYASGWLRQAMQRAIMNMGTTIDIPVHVHEEISRLRKMTSYLRELNDREPTIEELAESMGKKYSPEKIKEIMDFMQRLHTQSLDAPLDEDSDETRYSVMASSVGTPEDVTLSAIDPDVIGLMLQDLSPLDREIVDRSFGLTSRKGETSKEIAASLKITDVQVRKRLNNILNGLRLNGEKLGIYMGERKGLKRRGRVAEVYYQTPLDELRNIFTDDRLYEISDLYYVSCLTPETIAAKFSVSEREIRRSLKNIRNALSRYMRQSQEDS